MEKDTIVKYSKRLSKILRHHPDRIGVKLDKNGWLEVAKLIENFGSPSLSMEILEIVVAKNDKKRFAFNDDKTKIRANQGHTVKIDLGLEPSEPPTVLFHGTATKNIQNIENQGLVKGNRHHVHLSEDRLTAKKVGGRYGVPVVLELKAKEMHEAGYTFFVSENNVWLTDHVPTRFLVFPS
jgi:putative RNA 2'-phosphotransferase